MSAKISIVTVCFNSLDELKLTESSVFDQTYQNIEYIIIDGFSHDGTQEYIENNVIHKFNNRSIKITYLSEKDTGVYDAMNKAIRLATGDWLCFMNAGDVFFSKDTLERFFQNKILDDTFVVYGNTLDICMDGEFLRVENEENNTNSIMPFGHQSVFVRTFLIKKYLFNLKYKIVADFEQFYRMRMDNIKFEHINITVAKYDARTGISSTNGYKMNCELLDICEKKYSFIYFLKFIYIYIRFNFFVFILCFIFGDNILFVKKLKRKFCKRYK